MFKGWLDLPLSQRGVEQIEALNKVLPPIEMLYSSDLKRAREGAEIIGKKRGLSPILDRNLRERHFGLFEGLTPDQIRERAPEEFERWLRDPVAYTPPRGESTKDMRRRVLLALRAIKGKGLKTSSNVVVVTHLGVIRILIAQILSMPLRNLFRIVQDHGAVTVIDLFEDFAQLRLLNYRPSLDNSSTSLLNSP